MSTCSWKSIFCCAKTDNDSEADYDVLLKPQEPQGQVYRARLRLQKDQQDHQDITLIITDNKSAGKWYYGAQLPEDESHTNATKKSGGKSGLQMDRQDETQAKSNTSARDKDNSSQHIDATGYPNQQAEAEIVYTTPPPSSHCSVNISGMTTQYNLFDRITNLFRDKHRNPTIDLVRLLTSTSESEVLAVKSNGRVFFKSYNPATEDTSSIFFRVQFFSLLNPDRWVVMWIAYDSRLAIAARDQGSSDIKELFAIHPDNPTPPSDSDNADEGSDNTDEGPDNTNEGSDNTNEGPDNTNEGSDNTNEGFDNTNESSCFCWLPAILKTPNEHTEYFFYQDGVDSLSIHQEINDTSPATNGTSQEASNTSSDTNDTQMRICKDDASNAKIDSSSLQFIVTTVSANVAIN